MKQNPTGQLLEKYREGTISSEELSQLGALTHRDEVFAAVDRQVAQVRRRRRAWGLSALAAVLLAAGVAPWLASSPETASVGEVAELKLPALPVQEADLAPAAPAALEAEPQASRPQPRTAPARAVRATAPVHVASRPDDVQVVVCNNNCNADSVIDEIWKFLTA